MEFDWDIIMLPLSIFLMASAFQMLQTVALRFCTSAVMASFPVSTAQSRGDIPKTSVTDGEHLQTFRRSSACARASTWAWRCPGTRTRCAR